MEGVMMRKGDRVAVAIRNRDQIVVRKESWKRLEVPFRNWLFFRGFFAMIESMLNGVRAVRWSSDMIADKGSEYGRVPLWYLPLALLLTFGIFVVVPQFLVVAIGSVAGLETFADTALFHLAVGFSKVFVFVSYLGALRLTSDGKRLYSYHGAEHKVVNCYEAGKPLTIANAQREIRIHTRCGTTFLFIAIIFSALLFTIAFPLIGIANQWIVVLLKLLMIPAIAGVSFELLMKFGKHLPPALWMQRLTTAEPTRSQLEVAIFALNAAVSDTYLHERES